MKWKKARGKNIWTIPQFPFFKLIIEKPPYTEKYKCSFYGGNYNTFEEAAKACVEGVKKELEQQDLFRIETFVMNNGDGKYIRNKEWKKYIWLEAGYNPHSSVSKRPAIRFLASTPEEDLKVFGSKIQARHTNRFYKVASSIAEGLR